MRIRGVLVDYLIEVEETGIRDSLFTEGLQAIAPVVWEKPAGAKGDGTWCCGDLAGRVLFESGVEFGGCDEVRGKGVGPSRDQF